MMNCGAFRRQPIDHSVSMGRTNQVFAKQSRREFTQHIRDLGVGNGGVRGEVCSGLGDTVARNVSSWLGVEKTSIGDDRGGDLGDE